MRASIMGSVPRESDTLGSTEQGDRRMMANERELHTGQSGGS